MSRRGWVQLELPQKPKAKLSPTILIVAVAIICLFSGGLLGYSISYSTMSGRISELQNQISILQSTQNTANQNNTYILIENVSLTQLYAQVKDSVVTVRGLTVAYDIFRRPYYSQVQGSGFIYNLTGQNVIITNYHLIQDTINITVTFINGNEYTARILGSDPYAELSALSANAPEGEYNPLPIVDSSTLRVGDSLIAIGSPYGLAGSMTTGIVSALGRTLTEDMTGGYPIADVIQTSTPINPGNSGGPLLNYQGQVVGITTAIVTDSQGVGFAIPSSTVLREIGSLVKDGSYNKHPTIGASGADMSYEIAKAMKVDITYGWLVAQVTSGGPADTAGIHGGTQQVTVAGQAVIIGGDIIIAINGTRITNIDDLSTYFEEHTSPGQTINVTIVRNNQTMILALVLGARS